MRLIKYLAAFVVCILAGCGSVKLQSPVVFNAPAATATPTSSPAYTATSHVDCEQSLQRGCWGHRTLMFQWDPTHPLMKGLDSHPATPEDRQRRAQDLAPALWKAYMEGSVKAASPKVVYYLFWNVNDVPVGNMAAFRVNGKADAQFKHVLTRTTIEEVTTGRYMSSVSSLGRPHKVYRVRTEGPDAVGAELVFPQSMIVKGKTHMLKCVEGEVTKQKYPPSSDGKNPDGLHETSVTIDWLMMNGRSQVPGHQGSSRVLSAFAFVN